MDEFPFLTEGPREGHASARSVLGRRAGRARPRAPVARGMLKRWRNDFWARRDFTADLDRDAWSELGRLLDRAVVWSVLRDALREEGFAAPAVH